MRCLIDTHVWYWAETAPEKLSKRVVDLFVDRTNFVYLSQVSLWEIAIKVSIGKMTFKDPFAEYVEAALKRESVSVLQIKTPHIMRLPQLPMHHRDPFDRLLIAQAQVESMPLVSVDRAFRDYDVEMIWD